MKWKFRLSRGLNSPAWLEAGGSKQEIVLDEAGYAGIDEMAPCLCRYLCHSHSETN